VHLEKSLETQSPVRRPSLSRSTSSDGVKGKERRHSRTESFGGTIISEASPKEPPTPAAKPPARRASVVAQEEGPIPGASAAPPPEHTRRQSSGRAGVSLWRETCWLLHCGEVEGAYERVLIDGTLKDVARLMQRTPGCLSLLSSPTRALLFSSVAKMLYHDQLLELALYWVIRVTKNKDALALPRPVRRELVTGLYNLLNSMEPQNPVPTVAGDIGPVGGRRPSKIVEAAALPGAQAVQPPLQPPSSQQARRASVQVQQEQPLEPPAVQARPRRASMQPQEELVMDTPVQQAQGRRASIQEQQAEARRASIQQQQAAEGRRASIQQQQQQDTAVAPQAQGRRASLQEPSIEAPVPAQGRRASLTQNQQLQSGEAPVQPQGRRASLTQNQQLESHEAPPQPAQARRASLTQPPQQAHLPAEAVAPARRASVQQAVQQEAPSEGPSEMRRASVTQPPQPSGEAMAAARRASLTQAPEHGTQGRRMSTQPTEGGAAQSVEGAKVAGPSAVQAPISAREAAQPLTPLSVAASAVSSISAKGEGQKMGVS
jgi:hypothetical protein